MRLTAAAVVEVTDYTKADFDGRRHGVNQFGAASYTNVLCSGGRNLQLATGCWPNVPQRPTAGRSLDPGDV
jgi:hypothetical protein